MASLLKSPGTIADDATVGTVAWSNPSNAKASDDVYATVTLSSERSHYLKATNFGFSIPDGATINGIKIEGEGKTSSGSVTMAVYAVKGGVVSSNVWERTFTTTENYTTFGSDTWLFGETWTAADINSSNFGGAMVNKWDATDTISVDHIRITVYYTEAVGIITNVQSMTNVQSITI